MVDALSMIGSPRRLMSDVGDVTIREWSAARW
jgi:hypothetical protein